MMLQYKDLKEGSRVVIDSCRCIVRSVLEDSIVVDPIPVDACERVPVGHCVDVPSREDVTFDEWGVTKRYRAEIVVAVDMDYECMQVERCDFSLFEIELNALPSNDPQGDRVKKIAELHARMLKLEAELTEQERAELKSILGDR
jgi:hypothetical protein